MSTVSATEGLLRMPAARPRRNPPAASKGKRRRPTTKKKPPAPAPKIRRQSRAPAAPAAAAAAAPPEAPRTCRRCKLEFLPSENSATACRYHPEIFSGETKQSECTTVCPSHLASPDNMCTTGWMVAGDASGGNGEIHYYWTCCGASEREAAGCARTRHATYDDPPDNLTYC